MIPRITRGSSAYGAMSYDHGPGRFEEHRNPHKVAGNVAGRSWKERSAAIDSHVQRMHPKLTNPIIRTSLRIAPEDRRLTDREWREVANEYVSKMGFADAPWEAVRHADDHIHLTMSRVNWDGKIVDQWRDKTRAQSAVRDIERRHGLLDASTRYKRDAPELSRNDRERAARESERTGRTVVPEKAQLRERIDTARQSCDGTRASFEEELRKVGVAARANVSKPTERHPQGKMNGYSYSLAGHTDRDGEQVWFKGSDLGQKYGWAQTERQLNERSATRDPASQQTPQRDQHEIEGKAARSGGAAAPSRPAHSEPARRSDDPLPDRRPTPDNANDERTPRRDERTPRREDRGASAADTARDRDAQSSARQQERPDQDYTATGHDDEQQRRSSARGRAEEWLRQRDSSSQRGRAHVSDAGEDRPRDTQVFIRQHEANEEKGRSADTSRQARSSADESPSRDPSREGEKTMTTPETDGQDESQQRAQNDARERAEQWVQDRDRNRDQQDRDRDGRSR